MQPPEMSEAPAHHEDCMADQSCIRPQLSRHYH